MNAKTWYWLRWAGGAGAGLLLLAQAVPYGRDQTNPPVRAEPAWDSPRTRELAARACFDCHSNQTRWLWYHRIAPVSWLVFSDVKEGREELNWSEWDRPQKRAAKAAREVSKGEMPLRIYALAHPEARLSTEERGELVRGLAATFGDAAKERDDRRGRGGD